MNKLTNEQYQQTIELIKSNLNNGFKQMSFDSWKSHWDSVANELNKLDKIEINQLRPRYDNHKIYRINKMLFEASSDFEFDNNISIRQEIFSKYINQDDHVYDFGCGTGINAAILKQNNITCLDFVDSMQNVIQKINHKANFELFDMKTPRIIPQIKDNVIVTCHSMEQIGNEFYDFIKTIEESKPKLCIHIEPIIELYNNDELDNLAIEYHKSRNYLNGFLTYLLKSSNNIVKISRKYFGTMYHEGYSTIIWRP